MATTTNGIRYPLSSDAVNIATDTQNLATDIDTKIAAQTFGVTSAGQIIGSTGSTSVAIPIENRPGFLLEADSTKTAGVGWAADHYPNMFYLGSSVSTSGGTVQPILSFTSIPQIFQAVKFILYCQVGSTSESVYITSINGLTWGTANNGLFSFQRLGNTASSTALATAATVDDNNPLLFTASSETNQVAWAELTIFDYANQAKAEKPFTLKSCAMTGSPSFNTMFYSTGTIGVNSTTASAEITSISFQWGSSNTIRRWAAYAYGLK